MLSHMLLHVITSYGYTRGYGYIYDNMDAFRWVKGIINGPINGPKRDHYLVI